MPKRHIHWLHCAIIIDHGELIDAHYRFDQRINLFFVLYFSAPLSPATNLDLFPLSRAHFFEFLQSLYNYQRSQLLDHSPGHNMRYHYILCRIKNI